MLGLGIGSGGCRHVNSSVECIALALPNENVIHWLEYTNNATEHLGTLVRADRWWRVLQNIYSKMVL